jgi:thiamine-phosphate pyrophosphorylase
MPAMLLPKLYPIADKATLDARGMSVREFAHSLARSGVGILQYRDKYGTQEAVLQAATEIAEEFAARSCFLIMNDHPELAREMGWGVHVGQNDMTPAEAHRIMGRHRGVIGVSTHNDPQILVAEAGVADYVAVGPVFATDSKVDAEPVVGLDGVRRARALTSKPLVAIGGITRENARSVIQAGADAVAVISALFVPGQTPDTIAKDFLEILR